MEKINLIAMNFRKAIDMAKREGCFSSRDRMHLFPRGCCDDACDLLGYHLLSHYNLVTRQRVGFYAERNVYHAWLLLNDGNIIDLTGDQFWGWKPVYVGYEIGQYKLIRDVKTKDNFNIQEQERLWCDYQNILFFLKNI